MHLQLRMHLHPPVGASGLPPFLHSFIMCPVQHLVLPRVGKRRVEPGFSHLTVFDIGPDHDAESLRADGWKPHCMPLFEQLTLATSSNERGKVWPLDSGSKSRHCSECEQEFNVFWRKHQCVQCLHTVCRDCLQPGYFYTQGAQGVGQSAPETPSRVCKHCASSSPRS